MGRNNIKEDFNYRFVNPYNFIPLGKKCLRQLPQVKEQDCYTGYFDCSMSVLTPLFIPNTSSAVRLLEKKEWAAGEKEGYLGYDFFSYDDWSKEQPFTDNPPSPPSNPVIPGSEIRGAVRSVYEAAFNGCMSSIDGKRDLSRRCGEIKNPGMLYWNNEQRQWYLKNCGKARLRVEQKVESKRKSYEKSLVGRKEYDRWKEGQEIWIRIGKSNLITDYKTNIGVSKGKQMSLAGYKKGHLHKGEYIEKKKCEAVFYETGGSKPTKVCTEDVALLAKVLNEYRDNKKNGKIENDVWYKEYEISKDGSPILVYYAKDMEGHFYMCPACIGRESFKKTLDSLLKNNGEYQPCNDEHLCQACQIFGMMDKAEKPETYAYGSKIRFTDAMLIHPVEDSAALFEEPIVLPELGEPRPSAVEFYTESPYKVGEKYGGEKKQGYWTYDYKYTQTKNKQKIERVALYDNQPKIRGRKYYWHSEVDLAEFKDNQVSSMRQRIRPLKPDVDSDVKPLFQFRVYFEQLNIKQLEQLKWAIDFGNPDCAHKIGRGKPLGFGSIQIKVKGFYIREIDESTGSWNVIMIGDDGELGYEDFFKDSGFDNEEIPEALKVMSNWTKRPKNIKYPLGKDEKVNEGERDNSCASYQWFKLNKEEDNFMHNFSKVLPEARDDANNKLEQEKALYKLISKKK